MYKPKRGVKDPKEVLGLGKEEKDGF